MEVYEVQSFLESGYLWDTFFAQFRTIVPASIVAFNIGTNTATVKVAIQQLDASNNPIALGITLSDVPCFMAGGAQNYATFELVAGDMGLLLVCDRDIDNFKNTQGKNGVTNTTGLANLKDSIFLSGLFIPGNSGVKIQSVSTIQAVCGDSTLTLTPNQITLSSGGASIQLQDGNIVLSGNVIINNQISFGTDGTTTGNFNITGSVAASGDVTAGDISLSNHVHGGVQGGDSTTGGPQG